MIKAITNKLHNVQNLLDHCTSIRRFPPNSVIIYAGDPGDSLYYLIQGSIAVAIADEEGHEMIVSYLKDGDFFGEMGLFNEDEVRSATIIARSQCEVAEISYAKFKKISLQQPELFYAVEAQLACRLRATTRKAIDLAFLDVSGRVAGALLDMCKRPGALKTPGGTKIKVTRQELALNVSCSREMVGRVLTEFEDRGLITVKGRTILVSISI